MTLIAIVQAFATATTLVLVLVAMRVAEMLAATDEAELAPRP